MVKNKNNKKIQSLLQLALFVGIVILLNILANARIGGSGWYTFLDMTEEKRFTLTKGTKKLLTDLDEVVYVSVLLEGEFPAGFKRLQSATRDMLDDFRTQSGYMEYGFQDPNEGTVEQINEFRTNLSKDNINPINLRVKSKEGTSEKQIYPYAIFYYKGRNLAVNLLENEVPGVPPEVILNNSIGLLEYKFANAIQKLQYPTRPVVVFSSGHGELAPYETADLEKTLRQFYDTGRIDLDSVPTLKQDASVFVIAKPTQAFSEKDKFKIDQYIMNGGKVLWLLDKVRVDLDSLQMRKEYYPSEYDLGLDDLLFRYGARINPVLVLDMQCTRIPLATGVVGNKPQLDYFRYPYHIVATPRSNHPIVKSIGPVNLLYPNNIDTIQTKTPVNKTVLLTSSPNSRFQRIPIGMDFEFLRYDLDASKFDKGPQTTALLLEGIFPSLYENRVEGSMINTLEELGTPFQTKSASSRMIVVADGDIAKNRFNAHTQAVSPLGFNEFEKFQFANKEFLINTIEYLMDEKGVIEARGKEVKLRLLDTVKAETEEVKWQLINIVLPLGFLILFGFFYNFLRKRKYAK
ncbi:MAG: gliding motility-associated ABC transporter substrate-binding protein GldG [Saprospiraceae bacterium]|nr:MAG: gliding motility-associated ABC transporter substrate-binding protein GldG [Saprospiraceae bacterium]